MEVYSTNRGGAPVPEFKLQVHLTDKRCNTDLYAPKKIILCIHVEPRIVHLVLLAFNDNKVLWL